MKLRTIHKENEYVAKFVKNSETSFTLEMPQNIIYVEEDLKFEGRFSYVYGEDMIVGYIGNDVANQLVCPPSICRLVIGIDLVKRFEEWGLALSMCECFDKDEKIETDTIIDGLDSLCSVADVDKEGRILAAIFDGAEIDEDIVDEYEIAINLLENGGLIC